MTTAATVECNEPFRASVCGCGSINRWMLVTSLVGTRMFGHAVCCQQPAYVSPPVTCFDACVKPD